jgi:hypothetical protein
LKCHENRNIRSATIAIASIQIFLLIPPIHAVPPVPDFTNITAYRLALESSSDPQSKAILCELANAPKELAIAKKAAISAGILLTPRTENFTPSSNAYYLYSKWENLSSHRQMSYPYYADPLTLRMIYTPAEISKVEKIENESSDDDALMMAALQKPYFFDPDRSHYKFYLPWRSLRAAARELSTKATLLALRSRWMDATKMQVKGFSIQKQTLSEPSVIPSMVAEAVEGITIRGLQDILDRSVPNMKIDSLIETQISHASQQRSLKRTLRGDPIFVMGPIDYSRSQMLGGPVTVQNENIYSHEDEVFYNEIFDLVEARYLNSLQRAIDVSCEPSLQRSRDLERCDEASANELERIPNDPTMIFLDGITGLDAALGKHEDFTECIEQETLAAASVLSIDASTGQFPSHLPGQFIDPFSGKQLIYKRESNGFLIYSVGPTGHFDGNPSHSDDGWESWFRYPAPPPIPVPQDMLQ